LGITRYSQTGSAAHVHRSRVGEKGGWRIQKPTSVGSCGFVEERLFAEKSDANSTALGLDPNGQTNRHRANARDLAFGSGGELIHWRVGLLARIGRAGQLLEWHSVRLEKKSDGETAGNRTNCPPPNDADTVQKMGWFIFKLAAVLCIVVPVLLLVGQHAMIYHGRPYRPSSQARLPTGAVELRTSTRQGKQLSFYVPPRNHTLHEPKRVWVMFSGNASLALDWTEFVAHAPGRDDGFLLIEYPGYGDSEGSASPESIDKATEKAFDALVQRLGSTRQSLDGKMNVIGLSLGGGAALQFTALVGYTPARLRARARPRPGSGSRPWPPSAFRLPAPPAPG